MECLEEIQTDAGCCVLRPVRVTPLAVLLYADSTIRDRTRIDRKTFGAHIINVTLRGKWRFRGKHGEQVIDSSTAVLGCRGEPYACAHWEQQTEVNLIAGLRTGALDPDEMPIFGADTMPSRDLLGPLKRAADCEDDRFESTIFEAFDYASRYSLSESRSAGYVRMQRLKRFIEEHQGEQIGLQEMAAITGLSPFASVRQFKAMTGCTPYAYLLQCRLAKARRLLELRRLPIQEVALSAGFNDQGYFARFFKRTTGMTPTQYRRQASR